MISIRDYALSKGITYEAARKSVNLYKNNDLKEHIYIQGKLTMLDEEAVKFLDERRRGNPISIVINDGSEHKIKQLEEDNATLREKLMNTENELIIKNGMIIEAQEKVLLLTEKEQEITQMKTNLMEKLKELEQEKAAKEGLQTEIDKIALEREIAKQELEAERNKGFFERLFRKK